MSTHRTGTIAARMCLHLGAGDKSYRETSSTFDAGHVRSDKRPVQCGHLVFVGR